MSRELWMHRISAAQFGDHSQDIEEFEHLGATELRYRIASGNFFGNLELAKEWLQVQEDERREARDAATLEIAKAAAAEARSARVQARIANAIAAASMITAAVIAIWKK